MSSWEDRMAAAAHARWLQREETWEREQRVKDAEYERKLAEDRQAEFEAGPPDGCRECYSLELVPNRGTYSWLHFTIDAGDCTCYHECHGDDPRPCAPEVWG